MFVSTHQASERLRNCRSSSNLDLRPRGRTEDKGTPIKVYVDPDICETHGQCTLVAPDIFWLDDDGDLHYEPNPEASMRKAVEQAAENCPTLAIRVTDS